MPLVTADVEVLPLPPPDVEVVCPLAPEAPELVVFGGMMVLSSAEQLMPMTMRQGSATVVARNVRFIRSSTNN
jgi:hypothetical protein